MIPYRGGAFCKSFALIHVLNKMGPRTRSHGTPNCTWGGEKVLACTVSEKSAKKANLYMTVKIRAATVLKIPFNTGTYQIARRRFFFQFIL